MNTFIVDTLHRVNRALKPQLYHIVRPPLEPRYELPATRCSYCKTPFDTSTVRCSHCGAPTR
jgi:hypothetical protein